MVKTGYGMPSSHAQFVWYFAVSVGLWAWVRHSPSARAGLSGRSGSGGLGGRERRVNGSVGGVGTQNGQVDGAMEPPLSDAYRLQLHHPRLTHAVLSLLTLFIAVLVAASRVYLNYHTPKQVIVGSIAGTCFAVFWFGLTEWVRRIGLVEWVLDLDVVRMARIRDLLCEEDLVEVGCRVWEEKRRRRRLSSAGKKLK